MKRALLGGVAALVILSFCGMAFTADKEKPARRAQKQQMSAEEKAWREKLQAMTPQERRVAMATKVLDTELAPWKQVRAIAVGEKATKTVEAIDKIIAGKEAQFKKKLEAIEKQKNRPEAATRKGRGEGRAGGRKGKPAENGEN